MLVLSRRIGESIVIADNITVTILEVRGHDVRVGIDAPRDVAVHRAEVQALEPDQRATATAAGQNTLARRSPVMTRPAEAAITPPNS